jgi:diguanylate cyclase (GGDEF)-like protein/putative nucleotidyltransferase with HDIG domain
MVKAGVFLTYTASASGFAYVVATWEQPHRALIASMFVGGILCAAVIQRLPVERLIRGRQADAFFLTWSMLVIALVAGAVAADNGATSPLTYIFFLPMVFAAVFYPLRLFVFVGAFDMIAFVVVGDLWGNPDPTTVAFIAASLGMAAILCAWQAQNHDRQRDGLVRMSRSDPLTGCLNRRGLEECMAAQLERSLRDEDSVALILLDLDNFKAVNDMNGHAAGDELLCWVVEGLQRAVRPMDSIGRLGGDEFAILAPGATESGAEHIATRARKLLSERVAVSTGTACYPVHGLNSDELQRHADRQLYANKHGDAEHFAAGRRELTWAATLARAVDARMATPIEHSTIVARYAAGTAQQLGWKGPDLAHIRIAAMLHDIGKVVLPDRILQKPDSLDPMEFEEVKRHPETGAELINRVEGLGQIAEWVRHSHEHFDGSGYPSGRAGEDIPLASRILLVADAFDAITSDRPYRAAQSQKEALQELRRHAGRQFDPRCVDALEQYLTDTGMQVRVKEAVA